MVMKLYQQQAYQGLFKQRLPQRPHVAATDFNLLIGREFCSASFWTHRSRERCVPVDLVAVVAVEPERIRDLRNHLQLSKQNPGPSARGSTSSHSLRSI